MKKSIPTNKNTKIIILSTEREKPCLLNSFIFLTTLTTICLSYKLVKDHKTNLMN